MSTFTGWGVARLIVGEQPARHAALKTIPATPRYLFRSWFGLEKKFKALSRSRSRIAETKGKNKI